MGDWVRDVWVDVETGEWGLVSNLRALRQVDLPLNLGVATAQELRCCGMDCGLPIAVRVDAQRTPATAAGGGSRSEVTAARVGQMSPGRAYLDGLREGGDLLLAHLWGRVIGETDAVKRAALIGLHEQLRAFHKAVTPSAGELQDLQDAGPDDE